MKPATWLFGLLFIGIGLGVGDPAIAQTNAQLSGHEKKALMYGGSPPPNSKISLSHPLAAKNNFLAIMKNPTNNPKKGWTCDLTLDLMKKLGMDPEKTSLETLIDYVGKHHLGYRIFMMSNPGATVAAWQSAVANGMMPFAVHANNMPGFRLEDSTGIGSLIRVAGGTSSNYYSFGPSLEFYDALPRFLSAFHVEDAAESWANQAVAAKFARILDAHPKYNIWDAREHMRQAGSWYEEGWTERNGFGRVNEEAVITTLLPGSPVDFSAVPSRDGTSVVFTWQNFLQTDFAATVITKADGTVLYDGTSNSFTWPGDVEGDATFKYYSRNKAGTTSRMESFNTRTVHGVHQQPAK